MRCMCVCFFLYFFNVIPQWALSAFINGIHTAHRRWHNTAKIIRTWYNNNDGETNNQTSQDSDLCYVPFIIQILVDNYLFFFFHWSKIVFYALRWDVWWSEKWWPRIYDFHGPNSQVKSFEFEYRAIIMSHRKHTLKFVNKNWKCYHKCLPWTCYKIIRILFYRWNLLEYIATGRGYGDLLTGSSMHNMQYWFLNWIRQCINKR